MSQQTNTQLKNQSLVIRNETVEGGNTRQRHDDMNQNLIDSMVNNNNIRWRGAYDLSITNTYPVSGVGVGSAENGDLRTGDEWYISVAGNLNIHGLGVTPVNVGTLIKYLVGDPTLPASWIVTQR